MSERVSTDHERAFLKRLEIHTKPSSNDIDVAQIGQYLFKCEKYIRGDGSNYANHSDCRMQVYYIPPGNKAVCRWMSGVKVVLTSLPSDRRSTVHLSDFNCNEGNVRTDESTLTALEIVVVEAIKKLYNDPSIRLVTRPNIFDIGYKPWDGHKSSSWFAKRFNLAICPHGKHAILRKGSPDMWDEIDLCFFSQT